MQFQYTKMMAMSAWVLAMGAIGILSQTASPASWTGLALLAAVPPAVLWQFWNPPSQTMSESIQKILR
jgi:hypothetical protein